MFARVTPYKMKPGSREAASAILETLKDRIMALEGIQHFVNVMDDDGRGYVFALTTQPEMTAENAEKIKGLWAQFADHLEVPVAPPEEYTVIADWT